MVLTVLPTTPRLSDTAYQILNLNPVGCAELVVRAPGNAAAFSQLTATDPARLIAGDLRDPDMASAVACSLWLWHDYLDEAHRIAQSISTETGSYWHAIMHRRGGAFANSRYWLARAADHPVRQAIANQANILLNDLPADNRLLRLTLNGWNAEYFVDLVEKQHNAPAPDFAPVLRILQQLEWRVLTEYCASLA